MFRFLFLSLNAIGYNFNIPSDLMHNLSTKLRAYPPHFLHSCFAWCCFVSVCVCLCVCVYLCFFFALMRTHTGKPITNMPCSRLNVNFLPLGFGYFPIAVFFYRTSSSSSSSSSSFSSSSFPFGVCVCFVFVFFALPKKKENRHLVHFVRDGKCFLLPRCFSTFRAVFVRYSRMFYNFST